LKRVHLGAPGTEVFSTWHTADDAYLALSGTSMAAPHVAGALALIKARYPNEPYSRAIQRLLEAVDPLPSLREKCVTGGRLNLARALQEPSTAPATASPRAPRLSLKQAAPALTVEIRGEANRPYELQSSRDLVRWETAFTGSADGHGLLKLVVAADAQPGQRFYRARSLGAEVAR
jgi:subtilisin family serine protease